MRAPLDQLDLLEQGDVDAGRVDDVAGGVRAPRRTLAAELLYLLDRVDGDVAGARHHDPQPPRPISAVGEHLLHEVRAPVAGRLRAHLGAPPREALAGQHARLVAVGDPLVLAEQVADLAPADADVTGGHVGVLADVAVQLGS